MREIRYSSTLFALSEERSLIKLMLLYYILNRATATEYQVP